MKKEITTILKSFIGTVVLIVLGLVTAKYINVTADCIFYIRLISMGLIAWAVFGRLYNVDSWNEDTPPERFKKAWFVVTYSLGFYGAIVSFLLFENVKT